MRDPAAGALRKAPRTAAQAAAPSGRVPPSTPGPPQPHPHAAHADAPWVSPTRSHSSSVVLIHKMMRGRRSAYRLTRPPVQLVDGPRERAQQRLAPQHPPSKTAVLLINAFHRRLKNSQVRLLLGRCRRGQSRRLVRCSGGLCGANGGAGHEEASTPEDASPRPNQCRPLPNAHGAVPFRGRRGAGGTECSGTPDAHMMIPTIVRYQTATKPPRE